MARRLFPAMIPMVHFATPPVLAWVTQGRSLEEQRAALAASGQQIGQRLLGLHPSRSNYQVVNHIVGIERWGQSRLRVALGMPYVEEEYDRYRPPRSLSWNELQDLFADTRRTTIEVAREIEAAGREDTVVSHNTFGRLTVPAWLFYLNLHANWEMLKVR